MLAEMLLVCSAAELQENKRISFKLGEDDEKLIKISKSIQLPCYLILLIIPVAARTHPHVNSDQEVAGDVRENSVVDRG